MWLVLLVFLIGTVEIDSPFGEKRLDRETPVVPGSVVEATRGDWMRAEFSASLAGLSGCGVFVDVFGTHACLAMGAPVD
ncbi:hypothetical protein R1sor_008263 [Riccia sorocarpa]|uniref:Uncharacterized protein n=1 Tax=Riccia sorocarpa TaxID=122646 RepID=A0ABD3HVR5_9MARC